MREPLENEYFNWLCAKVLERGPRNYYDLLTILHRTEFIVVIPADQHRCGDAIELRHDFLRETFQNADHLWLEQPCSVLEVLISFAKRAQFQTEIPVRVWFWEFLTNLCLEEFRRVTDEDIPIIEDILNTFMMRTYDAQGNGGMFPMRHTQNDQRDIEIWYQFCEYVDDQGLI